jgi:hypothetical protein
MDVGGREGGREGGKEGCGLSQVFPAYFDQQLQF